MYIYAENMPVFLRRLSVKNIPWYLCVKVVKLRRRGCCYAAFTRKRFLSDGWRKVGEGYERKLLQIEGITKIRKDLADIDHWYAKAVNGK